MDLKQLQAHWNAFGQSDPLWAILTDPEKAGGKWEWDEFFRLGESEIDQVLERVAEVGIAVRRGRALDFGCGVGRLTQGLCRHFQECCGVDIAPSMVELARAHNRHGGRCRYELNTASDLRRFADNGFDFVYSSLVLQHIRPHYAKRYLAEFVRILAPGGCAVFRLPSRLRHWRDRVGQRVGRAYWIYRDCLARVRRQPVPPRMEMNGIPRPEVERLIARSGGEVRAVFEDGSAGPLWSSFLYIITKPAGAPSAPPSP